MPRLIIGQEAFEVLERLAAGRWFTEGAIPHGDDQFEIEVDDEVLTRLTEIALEHFEGDFDAAIIGLVRRMAAN